MRRLARARSNGRAPWSGSVLVALFLIAAIPASAWALPAETPQEGTVGANGQVNAVFQSGNTIYIGGEFTEAGGQPRNHLAALDANTGALLPWDPNANGLINALVVGPDGAVYAGGSFSEVGGSARRNLVKLDPVTGEVDASWRAKAQGGGAVMALASGNGQIYVGGSFSTLNGIVRNHIGAVDPETGAIQAWDPNATGTERGGRVLSLDVGADGRVFAGGYFSTIGGLTRRYLAALDPLTGGATAFNANIRYPVRGLVLGTSNIFLAGGGTGGTIASHSMATGAQAWSAHTTGDVHAIDASGTTVYVGGHFTYVGSVFRRKLAAFDVSSGALLDWDPPTNGPFGVAVVHISDSAVLIGGGFTKAGGTDRAGFARFVGTP